MTKTRVPSKPPEEGMPTICSSIRSEVRLAEEGENCSTIRSEMRSSAEGVAVVLCSGEKTMNTPLATTTRNWSVDDLLRDPQGDAGGRQHGRHFHQLFR